MKLSGRVTQIQWTNPHAWMLLNVNVAGATEQWAVEMRSADSLETFGWRSDAVPLGTMLDVEGWQARNGSNALKASYITTPEGRRVFAVPGMETFPRK